MIPATLIFTIGNPSRGDDAIGHIIYEKLLAYRHARKLDNLFDTLTDFQLQIEHSVDLHQRERILFVDASLTASEPYEITPLHATEDDSYSTHSMSPSALLATYERVYDEQAPAAFILGIRGYQFELGQSLSEIAAENLQQAFNFITSDEFILHS